jgi:CheY-like chemotaxis protein
MNGKIWIESEEGNGSTFHFTVELAGSNAASPRAVIPAKELDKKRVLIVDDNETNRTILTALMEQWGAVPRMFAHPEQVLDHLQQTDPYDMILMDYLMPVMDGVTLAKAIYEMPDYPRVPLIMLSSSYETIPAHPSIAARMAKPIKVDKLRTTMLNLLGKEAETVRDTSSVDNRIRPKKTNSLRILVAEDNPINQRVVQMMLQRLGYTNTVLVEDGREAVAAVQDAEYDLILMDVQMPHMNGLDATRKIREHVKNPTVPWIIALTAGVMEDERRKVEDVGMNGFLAKPMAINRLEEQLDLACERLKNN